MSKKSRERTERRYQAAQTGDILQTQKRIIQKAAFDRLGEALLFFVPAVMILVISVNRIGLLVASVCFAASVVCFVMFLRCFLLSRKIGRIQFSSTEAVTVRCRRVRFMTQPVGKYSANILCIIMETEEENKYWLISHGIPDGEKKSIRTQLLENEAELSCYCDSRIVKSYRITLADKPSRKEI
ncbi:MAG: hypothetical protein E7464_03415 [Ruminococcaceae bacterium]|nr:hypothetical protein [Oscillospiraceae bacterium]